MFIGDGYSIPNDSELCVGLFNFYCLQVRFDLVTELQEMFRNSFFEIARTITSAKKTVVKNGQSHQEDAADPLQIAFTKQCMGEEKIADLVNQLTPYIFNSTGLQFGCSMITEYVRQQRLQISTTAITNEACDYVKMAMQDAFMRCTDQAAGKAALVKLALLSLLIIPISIGFVAKKYPGCLSGMRNRLCGRSYDDNNGPYSNNNNSGLRLPGNTI